ncbi:hypothetical protein ACFQHW_03535 [Lapidilactobacillus achengensis]|uniref:Uncharacterized protein n=1 Tax=Lapidilactobacillus achengensis TaxID=2486000 RepID=A0ABW1UL16_9LACO|nr:hypothetical protein [Lapidilactobacillus achengensis]
MSEDVFFNPGDAIANAHDFAGAMQSAEIFKQKAPLQSPLIIVEAADRKDAFAVYFEKDAHIASKRDVPVIQYHIRQRLEP